MITPPITRVFRPYEVHAQWYAYEQSQSKAVGSVKPKPPGLPVMLWPQHRFEQFARRTAADLANVLTAAGKAEQAVEAAKQAATTTEPDGLPEAAEHMVEGFNRLSGALSDAGSLLKPAVRKWASRLPFGDLERIGIVRQPDGSLRIDAELLAEQLQRQPDVVAGTLTGSGGFADRLAAAADRLQSLAASSLIDRQQDEYRAFSSYTVSPDSGLQTYLSVPLTGTLLDVSR